jgi:hypothetical protein
MSDEMTNPRVGINETLLACQVHILFWHSVCLVRFGLVPCGHRKLDEVAWLLNSPHPPYGANSITAISGRQFKRTG